MTYFLPLAHILLQLLACPFAGQIETEFSVIMTNYEHIKVIQSILKHIIVYIRFIDAIGEIWGYI